MRRGRWWVLVVGAVTAAVVLIIVTRQSPPPEQPEPAAGIAGLAALPPLAAGPSWASQPVLVGGLRTVATAGPAGFALHTVTGDKRFLPGVNLGSTTPGHQPGELAITEADYRAWFAAMDRLGVRVVRNYTIHPPTFYTELAAHNRALPDRPLYLMQGVYLPDESYVTKGDLYHPNVTTTFTAELRDASAAVGGKLTRAPTPGHASGTWTTDVSDWLAGWIIGLEWDPPATAATDRANAAAAAPAGRYFRGTEAASPTERWLAARMDELATAEAGAGRSAPIAFVNWASTDPLTHSHEPLENEDMVGVDAEHVRATEAWPGGTFASYHAYPYYPDFQRHQPELQKFRYAGRADPYAGYLNQLREHHRDMPVVISEFGVPSSLGNAHHGPLGRDQGDHDEAEAMRIDAELLRMIKDLGLAGGFVFAWHDEWFKLTWNTVTHQVPADRRQLWHDPLTNEQYFGLIAADPAGNPDAVARLLVDDPAARPANRVQATLDESYLHLTVSLAQPLPARLTIGLDVLPRLSGAPPPGGADPRPDTAFALDLAGRTGQAWIRVPLDPMPLDYPVPPSARPAPVDGWQQFQQLLNREMIVPVSGRHMSLELFDVGRLRHGSWNPEDAHADSRALWRLDGTELTLRIPWAPAGFADPSSRQVLVPRGTRATTETSPEVGVLLSTGAGTDQFAGSVQWNDWQRTYHTERLKRGASAVRDALVATAAESG
ncbi:hypothetical protein Aca07nite_30410 [Actinoplanes capillaceus]|uniref:Uncharacterized protein n=1 Tax=Actinoplanes campanulatus TaxID=113559 RepID=A0ABQ3WHP3_9ACTN|nr:hypothetical protein [Actinoplanes capillaceus]GID45766.1 hypothetical protein Aca07nite_30410 [Actinoplanes capillaceus]